MKVQKNIVDYLLVIIQLILLILYFYQPDFLTQSLNKTFEILGIVPMCLGAIIFLWGIFQLLPFISVFPTPTESGRLITNGAFKLLRHPIYSGIIQAAFGYALYSMNLVKLLLALVLLLFFELKSSYEERKLFKKYPEYADYALTTGKFFPHWGIHDKAEPNAKQSSIKDDEED